MKIIPLSEGAFTIDKSKLFVPFDTETDDLQKRAVGSLLVEVQPFLVVTSEDVLLLDTGLGFEKDGVLQVHQNIIDAGINPSEVTKVLMSHLHKDHAGGMAQLNAQGTKTLAFPNAQYYVQRYIYIVIQESVAKPLYRIIGALHYLPFSLSMEYFVL